MAQDPESRDQTRPGAIERGEQVRETVRDSMSKAAYDRQQQWERILAEKAVDDALDNQPA